MEKFRVYGFKEFSKQEAPHSKTLPNGKIVKTYFVRAKELTQAWETLAKYLGKTAEMVEQTHGLYYVNLCLEQCHSIPWNRRILIR